MSRAVSNQVRRTGLVPVHQVGDKSPRVKGLAEVVTAGGGPPPLAVAHSDPSQTVPIRLVKQTRAERELRKRRRQAAADRRHYLKTADKQCAAARAWRQKNRERDNLRKKEWSRRNSKRLAQYKRERRAKNPEASRLAAKRWRERNREFHRQRCREYYQRNRERMLVKQRERDFRRKCLRAGVSLPITKEIPCT